MAQTVVYHVGEQLPCKLRTDNQMNDITNGEVNTGHDVHTVLFVCTCLYCGMVTITNPQISQHTS